jgi:corrinoid protein of di/trimethylamine methyltransferase
LSQIYERIANAIYDGDEVEVMKLAQEVIDTGVDPEVAIEKGGIAGLDKLGDDFEKLEIFLPELMLAAEAMKSFMGILKPHLKTGSKAAPGTVVLGTVKGDLHDIGKDLVSTQLSVYGFDVIDLGVDVSANEFINTARSRNADIIAASSLLSTSSYYMEEIINNLAEDGMRNDFKVVIGGGPITPQFAKEIGADGYAKTAFGAAAVCKELVQAVEAAEMIIGD